MISLKNLVSAACPDQPLSFSIPDTAVKGIECDSRKVEKDFVFVAIRGTRQDGHAFVAEAINRGAVAVFSDQAAPAFQKIPFIWVPDSRQALARLADVFYSRPSQSMKLVGITGTNGKTTSSFLIEHMLRGEREEVGLIGTVGYRFAGREFPAAETTPGPLRLQRLLAEMSENQCRYAVMEVSAHAIDQSRVAGIHFQSTLFTNLTQDHLDYFASLDRYFDCKARFFTGLSSDQSAVLNQDDPKVRSLKGRTAAQVITFGIENPADLRAEAVESDLKSTRFRLTTEHGAISVEIPLVGTHNMYNTLGALGVMRSLGFDLGRVVRHLLSFGGVPGRLERVDRGQGFFVFIDYAHTPDGLENVLRSLQSYKKGRLITLFGCGGDRDRGKRPQMARIASTHSDFVVITSDNPRSENPRRIADEICAGFPKDFKHYGVTLDRRKAIRQALLMARQNDIVLLAGKGHETTQVIGSEAFPFSDREETERVLDGR